MINELILPFIRLMGVTSMVVYILLNNVLMLLKSVQ